MLQPYTSGVETNFSGSQSVGPTVANISLPEAISTCPKNKLSTVGPAAANINLPEKNERVKSRSSALFGVSKLRVFDEQKNSIIATYTKFSRLRNFPLTVIAPVGRASEVRKQRARVDFT